MLTHDAGAASAMTFRERRACLRALDPSLRWLQLAVWQAARISQSRSVTKEDIYRFSRYCPSVARAFINL